MHYFENVANLDIKDIELDNQFEAGFFLLNLGEAFLKRTTHSLPSNNDCSPLLQLHDRASWEITRKGV